MSNLSDKTALVIDTGGEYVSFAQRLARDFKKVYYCTVWQSSFPKWNKYAIGINVKDIQRIDSPFEVFDIVDIICIPDLYLSDMADWLRDNNYKVFGSGSAEKIEILRDDFYKMQEKLGMPVPKYEILNGISELKKYLKNKENVWVKTNLIRGNGETFNFKNMRLSESRLDELQHQLGSFKENAVFVVSEAIDNAIEVGHDTLTVNGQYPQRCLYGLEIKDACYVSKVVDYTSLPKFLKDIDNKFANYFKENKYSGFYSTEVRWDGKKGYYGDATMRLGQPPSDLQQEIYTNFSEVVYDIAIGNVPTIENKNGRYGAQVIIKSSWATTDAQAIYFPEKYKNNVKIKHLMYKDNTPYYVPTDIEMEEIGSVVAVGNTLDEAIKKVKEIAQTVEGDCLSIDLDAFDEAGKSIDKFKKFNLPTI